MFNTSRRYIPLTYSLLLVTLLLPANSNARTPMTGWWNDKSDCTGKYYRYFNFNDRLRYFMPGPKAEHMHVQPIVHIEGDIYLDEKDNVEYAFNFKEATLNIHWISKNQKRVWHHCHEQEVQPAFLNMMRAYLINRSYIDLAKEGDTYSGDEFLFQQCIISYRNKDYSQAFDDCEFSWRSNNNGMSAYYLGKMYQWGSLGKIDYKKAYEWYTKSAKAGYTDSYGWLAWAHRFGKGTEINLELARENYLISARYGHTDSAMAAAKMLILGQGGDADYDHAEKLLKLAADDNNTNAINYLGIFYAKGWSGKYEPDKAFKFVKEAADKNNIRAKYNLGLFYILGIGTEQQEAKGEKLLESLENYTIIKEDQFLCASDIFQSPMQSVKCTFKDQWVDLLDLVFK